LQKGNALGGIPEVYGLLKAIYQINGKSSMVREKLTKAQIHMDVYRDAPLCGERFLMTI
jgi:hypothetical protein